MQLQPFSPESADLFLQYAALEGWITDRQELEFLCGAFPQGCLVGSVAGEPAAFVTALRYAASAWIGNLLVAPGYRRRGLGRTLMQTVLRELDRCGCDTVWLTASSDGDALYRSLGFVPIDEIHRWRAAGRLATPLPCAVDLEYAAVLDRMGWGDSRTLLFAGRQDCSGWLLRQDGFLRCLPVGNGQQLGPWGAASGRTAARLLESALERTGSSGSIFLDVPRRNQSAARLLREHGFTASGGTLLMYRGRQPDYRPELVFSLASMGSYG
jgi:ribosomal protein S18 acetylase RimI-like enzyme